MLRTHFELAQARGHSAAALFVDVKAAFDAMVRQVVFSINRGNDPATAIAQLRFQPAVANLVVQRVKEGPILNNHQVDRQLLALMQECHQSSWFMVSGNSTPTATNKGNKPGDPFGDWTNSVLMAALLSEE